MKQSNKLETWGNETTMNLTNILYQNIQASPYFKQLYELKNYHEVIDEIYNHVESLEPFLKGTTASTAFCLLYKLWTLRLTVKQVTGLIEHTDSPHIRALGFLYLRYVCKPANLWEWFEEYLDDEEKIQIQGGPRPVVITIGKMCRQLLTEQKWLGTILPRIPVPIARDIDQKLKERSRSHSLPRNENPDCLTNIHRGVKMKNEIIGVVAPAVVVLTGGLLDHIGIVIMNMIVGNVKGIEREKVIVTTVVAVAAAVNATGDIELQVANARIEITTAVAVMMTSNGKGSMKMIKERIAEVEAHGIKLHSIDL
ncbi:18797_t:CDS:2, partial [Acaulospora morrowiae]